MENFNNTNVRWKTWSPENIIFKSNALVKKVLPSEHILSWKSKGDRDIKMCKMTGCKATQHSPYANGKPYTYYTKENYKGIMVQLKDVKSDFPSANIDFIDWTERKDSVGNAKGHLDILIYLNSFHSHWEWKQDPRTKGWAKCPIGKTAPLREGYRMCYGGQGDANSLGFDEFHELVQITEMIRDFLVNVIVPVKNGEYVGEEDLLVV
jgi:hypothetical protein